MMFIIWIFLNFQYFLANVKQGYTLSVRILSIER